MLEVKQRRIELAEKEFSQLHQTLTEYQKRQERKRAKIAGPAMKGIQASKSLMELPASTSLLQQNFASSKTSCTPAFYHRHGGSGIVG